MKDFHVYEQKCSRCKVADIEVLTFRNMSYQTDNVVFDGLCLDCEQSSSPIIVPSHRFFLAGPTK